MDINIIFLVPEFQDSYEDMIHKAIITEPTDSMEKPMKKRNTMIQEIYHKMMQMNRDDVEAVQKLISMYEREKNNENK